MRKQIEEWDKIDKTLRDIMVDKSIDHSPMSVNIIGKEGIALEILKKAVRLCNILGIEVEGDVSIRFKNTGLAKFEGIEESAGDIRNWAQILMIVSRGKWGK